MKKNAIEYTKYFAFLLSKPNYFFQFAMGYPVYVVCSLDSPMNQNKNHEYDFEMKLDIFQKINHFLKERELCPAVVPLPNQNIF